MRGYDNHLIMQTIGEIANKYTYKNEKREEKQLDFVVISNNAGKYVFINSFQFMSYSLDKLVSNLPNDACKYTSEEIKTLKYENL